MSIYYFLSISLLFRLFSFLIVLLPFLSSLNILLPFFSFLIVLLPSLSSLNILLPSFSFLIVLFCFLLSSLPFVILICLSKVGWLTSCEALKWVISAIGACAQKLIMFSCYFSEWTTYNIQCATF